LGWQR